ncbi:hypothetical protein COO60DRAFT_443898 [Scenedesmus sp. NREL 46B-D3]|nr:hypothetical protein COO60DRAFT_443898 [Scenedesmus sp. NREL 46B-D3]
MHATPVAESRYPHAHARAPPMPTRAAACRNLHLPAAASCSSRLQDCHPALNADLSSSLQEPAFACCSKLLKPVARLPPSLWYLALNSFNPTPRRGACTSTRLKPAQAEASLAHPGCGCRRLSSMAINAAQQQSEHKLFPPNSKKSEMLTRQTLTGHGWPILGGAWHARHAERTVQPSMRISTQEAAYEQATPVVQATIVLRPTACVQGTTWPLCRMGNL